MLVAWMHFNKKLQLIHIYGKKRPKDEMNKQLHSKWFWVYVSLPTCHLFTVYVSLPTCHLQDSNGEWKSLPYEAAGAMVRSLMVHLHKYSEAHVAMNQAVGDDPEKKKTVTKKLVEKVDQLSSIKKFMVFNPRTGQMATESWLVKHIQVVEGVPKFKHPNKQNANPKILTLGIQIADETLDLTLDLGDNNMGPRPVRCYDLRKASPLGGVQILTEGFGHMGEQHLEGEEDENDIDLDEVEFSDSDKERDENDYQHEIPGDEEGLEGHVVCIELFSDILR